MKISIIWAWNRWLALGNVLANNNHEILMFSREASTANEINNLHFSSRYLNWIKFNESIKATDNLETALDFSKILVIAVPSTAIPEILQEIKEIKNKDDYFFINSTKGLNLETKKTVQQIIKEYFPNHAWLTSLLWPSFAKNVVLQDLTCIAAVSSNKGNAEFVQKLFSNNYFRVYTQDDVIWAEVYSSVKNAFAIASWILSWLWYQENAKASLICKWISEMWRIWKAMWAKPDTVYWLTWIWDLTLTCSSSESRNFQAWFQIWKADSTKWLRKKEHTTIEWLNAISVFEEIAKEHNLNLPILHSLYLVVYKNQKPSKVIDTIMQRPLKEEVFDFL